MTIFVNENIPGNDFSIRDKTGFSPDAGKNIVLYRRDAVGPHPVMLIDSATGNVDFRDNQGHTVLALDAGASKVLINGSDPIDLISKAEESNSRNIEEKILQERSDRNKRESDLEARFSKEKIDHIDHLNRVETQVRDYSAHLQSKIDKYQIFEIGSILSVLNIENFQIPEGWLPCEGQSVEGSAYHRKGYGREVPDFRMIIAIHKDPPSPPKPGTINLPHGEGTATVGWKYEKKIIRIN